MTNYRRWMHLVICLAAIALAVACSDDSTTGPGTQLTTDASADASVADDATVADSGGPDFKDVVAGPDMGAIDVPTVGCEEDVDCVGVAAPLCNVSKCKEGKCQPMPTAEGAPCDDDNVCSTGDVCQGGLCQGLAKTCNDAKPCTIDACNPATGECESTPAKDGEPGACDDGDACTDQDACTDGVCGGKAVDCDDNNPCTDDSCDLANGCLHKNNNKPCGDAAKCDSGGECKDGKCVAGAKVGCDDGNPCTVDSCDDATGLCLYKPGPTDPCDDGDACTAGEACADGECAGAKPKECPEGAACKPQSCNPADGLCVVKLVDGVACDDGLLCTDQDACAAGVCKGADKVCDDANPCTDDSCDLAVGCTATANTATCADDKNCLKGTCADSKCKVGTDSGCDDNNPCTADSCEVGTGCVYAPAKDGTACADATACQEASMCKAGKCNEGVKADCDDLNTCTDDSCHPVNGCGWVANEAVCEDGDMCTKGDKCSNGKCAAGAVVDVAKDCNDSNPCTTDTCDKTSGCVHAEHSDKCDDGSVCTVDESCKEGKCVGTQSKCEDGGPCKITNCDPKSGDCSWGSKSGPCDDGDFCTGGTVCGGGKCGGGKATSCDDKNTCTADSCDSKAGACINAAVDGAPKCDDDDLCTSGDTCKAGECLGSGAPICDDGNGCTVDKCDPTTGKCSFGPNKAPCDSGDLCTWGDTCSNGKCIAGKNPVCNDGSACTTDACDAKTGACKYTPIKDGTACKDAMACTINESCKAGKCVAGDGSDCALFSDTFECKVAGAGWWLDKPGGKKVLWLVDKTPAVGGEGEYGCNLNFNNGKDYCDKAGKSCQKPEGMATSPLIDGTKLGGAATVSFRTYYDLDSGGYDRPRVEVISEAGSVLHANYPSKSSAYIKKWHVIKFDVSKAKGQKFRVRFSLYAPSGSGGNDGKGWFVDNLVVTAKPAPEVCTDNVDNDGNGLIDCLDPACKGKTGCKEICGDGKDNDYDDKTDCQDTDCKSAVDCQTPFFARDFACGEVGWDVVHMERNGVTFAIDKTPAMPAPVVAECTLNFNNGKNFCGTKGCTTSQSSNANAGMATFDKLIDATGYKTLTAVYWSWIDAEPYSGQTAYYDRGFLQVSTDNFTGCCGATYNCGNLSNPCNTSNTNGWIAPRTAADQKKWRKVQLNLNKYANKKFQLRFRFNSGDGKNNATSGWFVDKLRLYGTK